MVSRNGERLYKSGQKARSDAATLLCHENNVADEPYKIFNVKVIAD